MKKKRLLNDKRRAQLRRLWASDIKVRDIAVIMGLRKTQVDHQIYRLGLPPRGTPPMSRAEAVEFRRMWMSDMPIGELALSLGISRSRAYGRAAKEGLPPTRPWARTGYKAARAPAVLTPKNCLKCGRKFASKDAKRNRVCRPCKSNRDWRSGADMESSAAGVFNIGMAR